ncbi:hypothetical protein HMPREF0666_01230 [Prevotella sp. C561]|nr:hypothetical protein HMPREF0666_01230 [Prevotella sp. C561]
MKLSSILALEESEDIKIYLHREGLFLEGLRAECLRNPTPTLPEGEGVPNGMKEGER